MSDSLWGLFGLGSGLGGSVRWSVGSGWIREGQTYTFAEKSSLEKYDATSCIMCKYGERKGTPLRTIEINRL